MSPEGRRRAAKLLLLLSSDKSGEVAAAASAIGKLLKSEKLDWHWLAAQVERDPPPAAAAAGGRRKSAGDPGEVDREELGEMLTELCMADILAHMTRREVEFVTSMSGKFDKYGASTFVSERQAEWIKNLYDRHVA